MASIQWVTAQTRGLVCSDLLYSQHKQWPLLCFSFVISNFHPSHLCQSVLFATYQCIEDVTKQYCQCAFIPSLTVVTVLFDVTYFFLVILA